ncbi:MAG: hypothetical protein HQ526_10575 [Actinobacteria bacterium]|nr:hypothetical protein [Actinomycetota bacterium]
MPKTTTQANPKIAQWLMVLTYLAGGVGLAIGFSTIQNDPPSLALATLFAVAAAGLLSFLRHSIFHRSDAVRMGWDLGKTNNFQIEVGIANLAWGLLGLLAVVFGWGILVQAGSILVFGLYLTGVAVFLLLSSRAGATRKWPNILAMAAFGVMLIVLGIMGINT